MWQAEIAIAEETMKIITAHLILLTYYQIQSLINISITSTTPSGISPIREENKGQNIDDAPSVAHVSKAPRFKIDRTKLEQLLSVGFPVGKL